MLKQYIYSANEVGFGSSWPSGELRLDGIEITADPMRADLFVSPGALLHFRNGSDLRRFPFIEGREDRHVFFDVSDYTTIYEQKNCILLRCNLTKSMLAAHPNSLCIPWPVEDFAECVDVPEGGFSYDVSFQGWLSTAARTNSSNACKDNPELRSDVQQYNDFTGYIYHEPEGIRRRAEFRRSMKASRIALCPESIPGHLPYRFLEAMSAGRVPLLVSSDYVLPFEQDIPYSQFILTLPADQAHQADRVALEFVRSHTDEQIVEMGRQARKWWLALLDCRKWSTTFTFAVMRKMKELGLTTEEPVLCA